MLMRNLLLLVALCLSFVKASAFDRTLRVDYIFSGNSNSAQISLSRMSTTDGWYGRSVNMDKVPVKGNGQIKMVDAASGKILYANSFSTLFQEWQATPEAKSVTKAFENTFLLPMPDAPATVEITLFNLRGDISCRYTHPVNPDDILIAHRAKSDVECRYLYKGGDPKDCIDVVIIAEGYTEQEKDLFYCDAADAITAIQNHEPFGTLRAKFNFLAVASTSGESGISVPRENDWRNTALNSHFDTFYMDRYLTTLDIFNLHDILEGLPYEHIIILANTDTYGGGGIYNSYTLTTAHHPKFLPVVVHEFGHSFGALADEYAYAGEEDPYYFKDVEPWEKNITTQFDFRSKWQDMIDAEVPGVGLVEGAGYQAKGVWRSAEDCRMRTNEARGFCPVCQGAIEEMILFYTDNQ
ncbi:MAG: peptidase M64 [Bacteroidales bacterium]|nr:peptidase M64 [Candidatus Cacconaster merdequi]